MAALYLNAGAIRHGISRALVKSNEEFKNVLKLEGLLTRDPRVKERKNTVEKELVRDSNSQNVNHKNDHLWWSFFIKIILSITIIGSGD